LQSLFEHLIIYDNIKCATFFYNLYVGINYKIYSNIVDLWCRATNATFLRESFLGFQNWTFIKCPKMKSGEKFLKKRGICGTKAKCRELIFYNF
jgi:hypothetical protein